MRPRILIVDDSLTVRMDLGEALQAAGFDTVLCADIRSAREALADERAALVVLDILLSDGSGLDFLKALRRSPTTAQVPVLLLSTREEVKNRVQTMDVGAVVFIGKPYDLAEVVTQAQALTQVNGFGEAGVYTGTPPASSPTSISKWKHSRVARVTSSLVRLSKVISPTRRAPKQASNWC